MKNGINRQGTVWENAIMGYHLQHGVKKSGVINFKEVHDFTDEMQLP